MISTANHALFHGLAEAATAVNDAEKALISLQAAPKDEQLDFATLALAMTRN